VLSSLKPGVEASLDWVSHDYLQTDAAINQGNSGGPLLNERGEAIGIVTAKAGGVSTEGLGFAIPLGRVLPIIQRLVAGESVPHAMLGLQLTDLTSQAAEMVAEEHDLALAGAQGALVMGVLPKSPAERAGIKGGDLIVSVGGRRVFSTVNLQQAVASLRPGASGTMELGVLRRGGQLTVRVSPIDFDEYTRARKEEEQSHRRSPSRLILMP
jgi:S1-C subfamily serine protease